jgi:uncharacterized membrane protein YfcA
VPLRLLQLLFAVLTAIVGLRLLFPDALPFHEVHHRSWWVYAVGLAVGLVGGVLAGLFGVGGGILFVPTFVLLFGITQLEAGASSLLAMLPASYIGAWRQSRYGNLNARAALTIGAASVVGIEAGIQIAVRVPDATLQTLFGGFLLVTSAQIAWRARRR